MAEAVPLYRAAVGRQPDGCFHLEREVFINEKASCFTINCACSNGGGTATNLPSIGENGNWFIGEEDTGIQAQGAEDPAGPQGERGPAGSGGDGITTFAVPDLRNEFLRGHHEEAAEQLSGDIGKHQNATANPYIIGGSSTAGICNNCCATETDGYTVGDGSYCHLSGRTISGDFKYSYTSRPTNVAVLYCIKFLRPGK